ncbi:MAG: hypothetical protein K0S56_3180 [Microvirga sp.]|nr:hypothetical protein [Microvirga sp.]
MSDVLLQEVINQCRSGERLCLLPISRVLVEDAVWLSDRIAIFPPEAIAPQALHVVEWPARRLAGIMHLMGDGALALAGDALHWGKSAATNLDLPDFFGSALLAFPTKIDWPAFLTPDSHEAHLEMLRAAMEGCERIMDLVRFEQCNLWTQQKLPGRVGLLEDTPYCAGLFYSRDDHESYIIAGEIVTHQLLVGVGTDMSGVFVAPIPIGELGALATHALRLYSEALEAQSETSRFVQLMSLIEFLANPNEFTKMQDAKKAIGRQIANDRADYEAIQHDFFYLATERGPVTQPKTGLRHNIVHLGKRLEDLTTAHERHAIFRRLTRYVGAPISQMIEHGDKDWSFIEALREDAKVRLGLT